MTDDKETVLEDWAIVAYLSLKDNIEITPFKKSDGRVAFRVKGDIDQALSEIYQNKKVGIQDYMKALRTVRNTIFILKSPNQ